MRILIIEEDVPLASIIHQQLTAEGYETEVCGEVEAAWLTARRDSFDLILLDLDSGNRSGVSLLLRLRAEKPRVPLLSLAARGDVASRVESLDAGADDCITKPFSFVELSARIRALLRRSQSASSMVLKVGNLQLDRVERRVERGGRPIELTGKEFSLLEYLMLRAGQRVTRAMILDHVWNLTSDRTTNVVDVYINYLRQKIEGEAEEQLIHTVRGVGYEVRCHGRETALQLAR